MQHYNAPGRLFFTLVLVSQLSIEYENDIFFVEPITIGNAAPLDRVTR